MIKFEKYIEQEFSNELKLLIFLSQDELNEKLSLHLENINWEEFVELTIKHRLISHVLNHSNFLADNFPIPIYEKLIDIRLEYSKRALNYAVHAIRIHQKFKENDILHCYFKGPLLSLDLYKDLGYRNFGDIDILVENKDAEKAKRIIEELDFICIYPNIKLTDKQRRVNYSISHHYHFKHPKQKIDIELHWSITNPKSFFSLDTKVLISNANKLKVSNYELPYISKIENIVYQAAHGSIHQFYRLFWLKDFSKLMSISNIKDLEEAWELSKKLKLEKCFWQACHVAHLLYKTKVPDFLNDIKRNKSLIDIPLRSINLTDLKQQGIKGKIRYVFYRLKIKNDRNYYFDLIYRLRTHLTDWERIKISDKFFFLYYLLRPFLLLHQNIKRK